MQIFNLSSCRLLHLAIVFFSTMSFCGLQAQISTTTISVNSVSVAATGATTLLPEIYTGSSTSLSVVGGSLGADAVWTWYADGCGIGASIGTGVSIIVSPNNQTTEPITRTYFVRAEGVCNTTTCAQVSVIVNPTPIITSPLDAVYCAGELVPAEILVCTADGMLYNITGGANIGLADVNGVLQIPAFIAVNNTNASITSTITVSPQTLGTGILAQTYTITVAPNVVVTPIANQILCNGTLTTAATLSSNMLAGVTYNWTNNTPSIGLAASGTGNLAAFTAINNTCENIVATITVMPTVTDGSNICDQTPMTFTITVRPTPNGTLASNNAAVCGSDPAMLTFASSCGTGPFSLSIRQDGVVPALVYGEIISGTPFMIRSAPLTAGVHTFDLMVITDANGCINQ